MINFKTFFICFILLSLNVNADDPFTKQFPKTGNSIHEFIPNSWKVIAEAWGDLNFDKKKDTVLIIESTNFKRVLLILLNQGKHLELFQAVRGVIPSKTKKSDFFSGISINSGQLIIEQQGGENLIWKLIQVYKFRKDAFYLISQKNVEVDIHTGRIRHKEFNFLKGLQTTQTFSKEGKLESERIKKLPKQNLQKLESKI